MELARGSLLGVPHLCGVWQQMLWPREAALGVSSGQDLTWIYPVNLEVAVALSAAALRGGRAETLRKRGSPHWRRV